ncbi:MAG: hypothetical protein V3V55_05765 [Rhodospirillales bacterium]
MIDLISKVRFLPITIFFAVLLLTVKVGDIWNGFDGLLNGAVSVLSGARAQEKATPAKPQTEPSDEYSGTAAEGAFPDAVPEASKAVTADPTLLTQSEIDLLQQLAERREVLEFREKELAMRTGMLKAAESRIDKKIVELKDFQATIQKLMKTYDEQQNQKIQSLVKIYENMKPKDAARIFEELEMNTLLLVIEQMKERKLAPIMAKMNPAKATEITVELARLRNMPTPGSAGGG